jgi:hypothetical protein
MAVESDGLPRSGAGSSRVDHARPCAPSSATRRRTRYRFSALVKGIVSSYAVPDAAQGVLMLRSTSRSCRGAPCSKGWARRCRCRILDCDGAGAHRRRPRTAAAAKKRPARASTSARRHPGPVDARAAGSDFELKPIMKPLEPFRQSMVVVTNLLRPERGSTPTTPVRAVLVLAGLPPKRTAGPRLRARRDARSGRGQGDRPGNHAAVARARDRGLHRPHRRLLAGIQLRAT